MVSFQSVFRSDFVFPYPVALRQILAFLPMPFIVLFRVPFAVFCLSGRPIKLSYAISGLALRRLLVASFGRSVSLYPAYFSSLMTFLAAAKIQEAKAIFPLNSFFETREITNKQRQGIRGDVSLVIGPNGDIGGSYRFSGHAKE